MVSVYTVYNIAGSQLHVDPDLMGAWNMLLTGRKWWAVLPYRVGHVQEASPLIVLK